MLLQHLFYRNILIPFNLPFYSIKFLYHFLFLRNYWISNKFWRIYRSNRSIGERSGEGENENDWNPEFTSFYGERKRCSKTANSGDYTLNICINDKTEISVKINTLRVEIMLLLDLTYIARIRSCSLKLAICLFI